MPVRPWPAIDNLLLGFTVVLPADNLLYCFLGVLLGHADRRAAGLGPAATVCAAPASRLSPCRWWRASSCWPASIWRAV